MLPIGTLAKRTGIKVQTIRYYEQIGLMREPGRSVGGQRRYTGADLDRLAFIRHARELGFSLDAIRELLDLSDNPNRSCADADAIAQANLAFRRGAWRVSRRGQDMAVAEGYQAEKRLFGVSILYLFAPFSALIADAVLAAVIGQPDWPVWF